MAAQSRYPIAASRRIAVVVRSAGALAERRSTLLATLAAAGHRVTVFAGRAEGSDRASLAALGVAVRTFPLADEGLRALGDRPSIDALAKALVETSPNVILAIGMKAAVIAARGARRTADARLVIVAADTDRRLKELNLASRWLVRRALKRADAIVVYNRRDAETVRALDMQKEGLEAVVIGGAGVDLVRFAKKPLPSLDGGFVFAMTAAADDSKAITSFCEAAIRVAAKAPSARFRLALHPAGSGAPLPHDTIDGYARTVDIIPAPADIRPFIEACHVFVHPSHGDGFAHPVAEALAVGRPAITTTAAGCRETIDERVSGVLVPPGDVLALAAAMESFLRRPDLMAWMSDASRQKAERRFDARVLDGELIGVMQLEGARA